MTGYMFGFFKSALRHSDSLASGLSSAVSRVKHLSSEPNRTGNDKSPESAGNPTFAETKLSSWDTSTGSGQGAASGGNILRSVAAGLGLVNHRKLKYRNSLFYGSTVENFLPSAQTVSPTLVSFQYTGNSIAHVVQRCTPAVVQIETFTKKGFTKIIPAGSGSGFIISSNGIIVTAAHVLKKIFHVRLASGEVCRGTVLHIDEEADIAIIRIKAKHPLPFLPLKGLSEVLQGHVVLAMGSPFVLQNWMAFGIVNEVRRSCAEHRMEMNEMSYVQHDATLEYGYSGGPLLNLEGEVIGMHVSQGGEGIAISVDKLRQFL